MDLTLEREVKKTKINKTAGICLVILVAAACRPPRILLSPVPSRIERIEGYARLKITDELGSQHLKFSFLLILPSAGRIDVSDFMGRSLYQIIISDEKAYLTIPSKKVFWQGKEEEVINKFLGFNLNLSELVSLFSGHWPASPAEKNKLSSWELKKDKSGRIIFGQRGDLLFEVEEFIENTQIARSLIFKHPLNQGRLKFLRMDFNQPGPNPSFFTAFLKNYEKKTWEEIQVLFK
jgi:hypothetical protein